MITVDGVEYVTTTEAVGLLGGDVNAALIQDWVRRGLLTPAGRHPGKAHVFVWAEVLAVEAATYQARSGRPRLDTAVFSDQLTAVDPCQDPVNGAP